MKNKALAALLISGSLLTACVTQYPAMRKEVATRVAAPAWMIEREHAVGPVILTFFERMHERHAPANIYIGGRGFTKNPALSSLKGYHDMAPKNPVALHLAAYDKADNVAFLALPCQYSGPVDRENDSCANYTGNSSLSPEVVQIYMTALDDIAKRYDIKGFNLIGFDYGGGLAALLAAERKDVLSLRTVAGTLDTAGYLTDPSFNPVSFAHLLPDLPQYHFSGEFDTQVPASVYYSYESALGEPNCSGHEIVENADHMTGWVNKWPDLLKKLPRCKVVVPQEEIYDLEPLPQLRPPPIITKRDPDLYKYK